MTIRSALLALSLFPIAAMAAPSGYVDVYFVPSAKVKAEAAGVSVEDSGDGLAVKTLVAFDQGFFAAAEYQKNEYDDLAVEFEQVRAGLGLYAPGEDISPFGLVEYVRADATGAGASQSESGYGAHVGLRGESGQMGVTLQFGYVDLGDADGPEGLVEMDYQFTPRLGAIIGYRVSNRETATAKQTLSDLRIGLSLYFGK